MTWAALATATPCDAGALRQTVETAGALAVPAAYEALADCDARVALATAPAALAKMFGDEIEYAAAGRMIDVGAGDAVREWLTTHVRENDRLATLRALGRDCETSPARSAWFLQLHEDLGDGFFTDRWHRGLAECRTPEIRSLLATALESPTLGDDAQDRGAFLDVLEVYAQNLRGDALPLIERYATALNDVEEVTYVLQMLPRAAGFDTPEGVNDDDAASAADLVTRLAPTLNARQVDISTLLLRRIGQDRAADRLVRYRWPDAWRVGDGQYTYGVVAVQSVSCKPGKSSVLVLSADVIEHGTHWPDQLADAVTAQASAAWDLPRAPRCDVTPTVAVTVSAEPLKTAADRAAWRQEQLAPFSTRIPGRKVTLEEAAPFAW